MTYRIGHINPWWDTSFKDLDYEYYPLTNDEDEKNWISQGYKGLTLNGGIYKMPKPMPEYAKPFFTMWDWENVGLAFYRQNTLEALPLHFDKYTSYVKMFNIKDPNVIWRCIVFLEDWRSGHYFEIGNSAHLNWRAGDYICWNNDEPHFAGNFGIEPKYTMQITGMQCENR